MCVCCSCSGRVRVLRSCVCVLFEIYQTMFKFALLGHTKHPHARRADRLTEAELPLVDARRGIPLDLILLSFRDAPVQEEGKQFRKLRKHQFEFDTIWLQLSCTAGR